MMDAVGHSIAMGNATDKVKEHADDICSNVLENGVAEFIMKSGLFFEKQLNR